MIDALAQINATEVQTVHRVIAAFVVALAVAALAIIRWRIAYRGLDERQARVKKHVLRSKYRQTPETVTLREPDEDAICALWEDDAGTPADGEHGAIAETIGAVQDGISRLLAPLPTFGVRLVELAVLVAVGGAVAVSTESVVQHITKSPSYPGGSGVLESLTAATSTVVDAGATALTAFPHGELVANLVFAYGTLVMTTIYQHWYVTAGLLLVGAAIVSVLDRRIEAVDTSMIRRKSRVALRFCLGLGVVWLAGVLPHVALAPVVGEFAGVVGFVSAALVGLVLGVRAGAKWVRELARTATDPETLALEPSTLVYLVARKAWGVLAVLVAPLVPVYFLVAIVDGSMWTVATAIGDVSVEVQVLLAAVAAVIVLGVVHQAREAWGDIRSAAEATVSNAVVRAFVLKSVLTVFAAVVAGMTAYGVTESLPMTFATGAGAGILARVVHLLGRRALFHGSILFEGGESDGKRAVSVHGYRVETGEGGEEKPYAVIGGRVEVMRDDVGAAVADVEAVVDDMLSAGEVDANVGVKHAEYATEFGVSGDETAKKKTREKIRKQVWHELRRSDGPVPRERVEERCDDLPPEMVEECLRVWRQKGYIREKRGYLRVKRDPWSRDETPVATRL
ncbi:hypothetical protein [Halopenitus persicus]|uniref:hypothetical protein n=1 Tax=Halopenitus persicus TaxID=1048396 RepID=UPI000BBAC3E8|nr:hypothetical protein [Halopenitus persicus]